MSWMGSVLTDTVYFDASGTNVPASSANSAELIATLSKEASSIMVQADINKAFYLTIGAAGAEENILLIDGFTSTSFVIPRMPLYISAGVRLGIRAQADAAITSGTITINLWS